MFHYKLVSIKMVDFDEMCVFLQESNMVFYTRKVKETVMKVLTCKCISLKSSIIYS